MTAALWALHHWKLILSALGFSIMGLMLLSAKSDARHWHKESDRYHGLFDDEQRAFRQTVKNYRAAAKQAEATQAAHIAAVEGHDNAIQKEQSHVYETKRDVVRRYFAHGGVPRQPTGADQRVAGAVSGAEAAEPAAGAEGAGGSAVVPQDDLRICAENTLKAQTWLEWWGKVEAEPR